MNMLMPSYSVYREKQTSHLLKLIMGLGYNKTSEASNQAQRAPITSQFQPKLDIFSSIGRDIHVSKELASN